MTRRDGVGKASRWDDPVGGRGLFTKNADAANEGIASTANASDSADRPKPPANGRHRGWLGQSCWLRPRCFLKGPKVSARNIRLGTDRSHCCSVQAAVLANA